jgi:integrase
MGSLYKRGNVWWMKYYQNGRPIRESTETEKQTEAKRLLKLREGQVAQGKRVIPRAERLRFEDLAAGFLADYQINGKRSLDKANVSVKRLQKAFAGWRASRITTADVQRYAADRKAEGASNATINRELAALKRMMNLAIRAERLPSRPYISMLREDNVRKGFFEGEALLAVVRQLPSYLQPVTRFADMTGWRKEEVLALTWRQVDLTAGTVRLEPGTTKNGEGRMIFRTPELHALLEEQRAKTATLERQQGQIIPWVFHRHGEPIKGFKTAWRSACKKAGQPAALFHDLRRTAVRNIVRAGVPERVAMQITGHKTRAVFERYNIVSEGDLREAARKLSGTAPRMGTISGTTDGKAAVMREER